MARTKNQRNTPRPSATPVMDPWDVEHQQSLATHGPMASTNHTYPITVHRGFDAQFTAEPLTRRYPIFEETESHRAFLVRTRSERLITTGKRDNYYTPEQLWEEDDRLRGRMQFAREGEPSWVDEEEDSSDEEQAEGPVPQQNDIVRGQSEVEPETDLPIALHAEDHVTTVAAVTEDHEGVQDLVTGLDLSTTAPLLALTSTFTDGTIAVALCGQQRSHEEVPEDTSVKPALPAAPAKLNDSSHPVGLDRDAAGDTPAISQEGSTQDQAGINEWNVSLKDAPLPTVSLLSGAENFDALMATTDWDTETTIATVVKYSDGRVVALLMGQQREKQNATRRGSEIEYGLLFAQFFQTVGKSSQHNAFPHHHKQLLSLLGVTRKDLVKANAITDLTADTQQHQS